MTPATQYTHFEPRMTANFALENVKTSLANYKDNPAQKPEKT